MKVAAVIPARMASTRLPGKPLRLIAGVPLIIRVLDRARSFPQVDRIIVATEDDEILRVVRAHGGEAWLTSRGHRSGSDRVAEVAAKLSEELVLNLQGDEPLLPLATVAQLVECGRKQPELTVVTAAAPLSSDHEFWNPNVVKVVGSRGRAERFFRRPAGADAEAWQSRANTVPEPGVARKHIGIYLFRREFLRKFVKMPATASEISDSLEQWRVLENGYPVFLVDAGEDSVGVDTEEDVQMVETLLDKSGPRVEPEVSDKRETETAPKYGDRA